MSTEAYNGGVDLLTLNLPVATVLVKLGSFLESMQSGSQILLAMILGAMIAFDMGGPVNKAAFFFGAAMIKEGNYTVMGACAAAICLGAIAFSRGEHIGSLWLLAAAACTYLVGYRFYGKFIAARVMALDDRRATPCEVPNQSVPSALPVMAFTWSEGRPSDRR